MALVTTIGSKNSNSYITLAYADSVISVSSIYDTTAWNALTDAAREERLVLACLLMNRLSWAGFKVYTNQALAFPRWWTSGDEIEIPENVQKAQALIAYDVIHRGTVNVSDPSSGTSKAAVKSLSLFQSLSVTRADGPMSPGDASLFEMLIRSSHFPIYLLIEPYLTLFTVLPEPQGPELLNEVT
ncbi:MAG: hypothetical protein HY913_04410 [Desulfomonile tiedjei]|nr:hypothetical protein [Desulfomonile tiedjei]